MREKIKWDSIDLWTLLEHPKRQQSESESLPHTLPTHTHTVFESHWYSEDGEWVNEIWTIGAKYFPNDVAKIKRNMKTGVSRVTDLQYFIKFCIPVYLDYQNLNSMLTENNPYNFKQSFQKFRIPVLQILTSDIKSRSQFSDFQIFSEVYHDT